MTTDDKVFDNDTSASNERNASRRSFWPKQPVFLDGNVRSKTDVPDGPIRAVGQVRHTPYALPESYAWKNVNITMNERETPNNNTIAFSRFISNHYVEDPNGTNRLVYSPEFFDFYFHSPPMIPEFNICIFFNELLIGSITGQRYEMKLKDKVEMLIVINFLCVHKEFRKQNIAPVLIKEITRRANLRKIYYALYTSGTNIHKALFESTYYHKVINQSKLVQCGFFPNYNNSDKEKVLEKLNEIKIQHYCELLPISKKRRSEVYELFTNFIEKTAICQKFTKEQFTHITKNIDNVIESFMVVDDDKVKVFISYFVVNSASTSAAQEIKTAYIYHYAYLDNDLFNKALKQLFVHLKEKNFDLVNCLTILKNQEIIDAHRFGPGTGNLRYYLYNYHLNDVKSDDVAVVLF